MSAIRVLLAAGLSSCALLFTSAAAAAGDPAATVDAYRAALKRNDTATALGMLAADATLFEQGFVERARSDYAGAHITADADFAAATSYEVTERKIVWLGDAAACVLTQNHITGTYQKQRINLVGTETVLLRRAGDGWIIQHVHASAHPGQEPLPPAAKP